MSKIHHCWTEEAVNRYFTTEAMAKDKDVFLQVHLPISQIIVDKNYNAFHDLNEQEYTDEEGLKHLILKSTSQQPNRIFSLIGETGSGKSELCQWLSYQIQDRTHIPILIRRSMTRLRDIVAEINRHLNEPVPGEMKDITDLWEEFVSKQLVASMLLYLQQPQVLNEIGSEDSFHLRRLINTDNFELRMRQNFIDYRDEVQQLDKARELNLLPEQHFRDLVVAAGGLKKPTICYQHLQRAITDCLATTLQVEDLVAKLRQISVAFMQSGQRPVLLIEDITTFSFLQNDLLDYLFDLGSGNFDVVIGITTDFERTNEQQIYKAQQTIRERIEGRFVLTDEQNETLFLRENYAQLATLYLNAIKNNDCSICNSQTAINQAFGDNLYPFNQPMLENIYKNLQQDGNRKQTPRLFLRALSHVLRSAQLPFESIENVSIVRPPTTWCAQSVASNRELEKLLKWYGYNTNQGVFLNKQVAGAFSISIPSNIEVTETGYYRFNLRPGGEHLPDPPDFIISKKSRTRITNVEPRQGQARMPNTITISGTNFQSGCTIHLGERGLSLAFLSNTRLKATIPADLLPETYDLTVINPDGGQANYPNAYTVTEPASPSITQVQPIEGEANQINTVFIQGTNFQNRCVVYLGSTTLAAKFINAKQLSVTIPANMPAGTYDLTVTNPDGKKVTWTNAYTVKPEDLFGQLDQWLERQGVFPGRTKFKEGVWKLLDMFQFEPFVLQHSHSIASKRNPLIYSRGDKDSQIYLHGSADSKQPGYLKLTIHPQPEFRDLYSQVLALGQELYQTDDITQLDHPLLYDWLRSRVDDLQQEMHKGLATALGMPLPNFIVLTKFLLLNNTTGLCDFTTEALAQPLFKANPFSVGSMGNRPEKLATWWSDIQSLFQAFFHFRDNIVNYPRLQQVIAECDPLHALYDLRNIDSRNIYEAYTIGSAKDAYPLRGLVDQVSLYARDLVTIQQNRHFTTSPYVEQLRTIADLCPSTEDIDPEKLRTQLDQLRSLCTRIGMSWQRQWDLSLRPLDDVATQLEFQAAGASLRQVISRYSQLGSEMNVFIYLSLQREIQTVTSTPEYEVLNTIHKIDQQIAHFLTHRSGSEDPRTSSQFEAFHKKMVLFLKMAGK